MGDDFLLVASGEVAHGNGSVRQCGLPRLRFLEQLLRDLFQAVDLLSLGQRFPNMLLFDLFEPNDLLLSPFRIKATR